MKEYLLILLSVLGIGMVATPNLTAALQPELTTIESTEVADLPELSALPEVTIDTIEETAEITTPAYSTPIYSASTPVYANFSYNVTQVTSSVVTSPSNYDIYRTGKLVYAHNDENLMLSALSLTAGSTFTITENGVTSTYTVSSAGVYAKADLEAIIPGTRYNRMSQITAAARDENGVNHRIALMTCYERSRSAAHRYVIYAD